MELPIKAHEDTFFSSLHSDLRMKSFLSAVVWWEYNWEGGWHLALLYLLFTGSLFQKLFPSLTNKIIFLSFFKPQPFWVCCKLGKQQRVIVQLCWSVAPQQQLTCPVFTLYGCVTFVKNCFIVHNPKIFVHICCKSWGCSIFHHRSRIRANKMNFRLQLNAKSPVP